ncbi:uncharacterized protein LOC108907070 [Anoplophora glabripennis]|uniref:uncharacterized protein LOC108907070 n=1 Tax=Anoplophora glabripennis TaxID=217634 RepID=UPI0008737274|nr:uncharacterized protein LOC108907070 [Anoplophora glabripennis]
MDAAYFYEELFKSQQSDIKLFKLWCKRTKFLGLTPYSLKTTKLQKFVSCVIISPALAFLIFFMYTDSRLAIEALEVQDQFIQILLHLSELFFMIAIFLSGNLLFDKNWRKLFTSLYQTELLVKKLNSKYTSKSLCFLYLELFIIFAICLPLHVVQIFFLLKAKQFAIAFINFGWFTIDIYSVITLLLLLPLNKILSGRYQFLCQCLETASQYKREEKRGLVEVKLVLKVYRLCHCVVKEVNTIFGWHVYFYIIKNQNFLITLIQHNLLAQMGERTISEQFGQNVVYCLSYVICMILLIMSFDSVETSGKKLIMTCYLLHESSESPLIKEHLLQLAKFAEEWKPTFSAAGFYTVNKLTLSSIFKATIKYLVALMQLNLAMADSSSSREN